VITVFGSLVSGEKPAYRVRAFGGGDCPFALNAFRTKEHVAGTSRVWLNVQSPPERWVWRLRLAS